MIFLSYSRRDGVSHVTDLEMRLNKLEKPIPFWRDIRDLRPDQDFTGDIEKAIESSDYVVVCITPDTKREDSFVRREIQYALALKKPVIPYRCVEVVPHISIVNNEWIDTFKNAEAAFNRLHAIVTGAPYKYELPSDLADPFRPYLESALKFIVEGLRQRIIVPIDLKAKDTPDAVIPPLPLKPNRNIFDQSFSGVKMGTDEAKLEKRDFTTFREGFEAYRHRVLLLGEPGAGKTITLMAYARDAYAARLDDPTQPLPLYNLVPTWDAEKRTQLHEWIAEAHGLDASVLNREIDAGRALLLLDGLDELGRERETKDSDGKVEIYDPRLRLLEALPSNNRILLTSRVQEYNEIAQKTLLNGAITLQSLDETQMRDYLREQPELLVLVKRDSQLHKLTSIPLLMSIFAYTYRDLPEVERQQLEDMINIGDLRDKIFMRYIDQRYKHEQSKINANLPFTLIELKDALGYLAIENTQQTHLKTEQDLEFWKFIDEENGAGNYPTADVSSSLTEFAMRLNLLVEDNRFIHLLLRDTLAFNYAIRDLRDANEEVRIRAIEALEKISDSRAASPLTQILHESNDFIRLRVARTLRKIGTPAVAPLIDIFYGNDESARRIAVNILGQIGSSAIDALRLAFLDRYETVHHNATDALVKIGVPAVETLINFLQEPDWRIRRSAIHALIKIGDTRAVNPLIGSLNDPDHDIRRIAAFGLGIIGNNQVITPLISALQDGDKNVRLYAGHALERIGTPEALEAVRKWRESQKKR